MGMNNNANVHTLAMIQKRLPAGPVEVVEQNGGGKGTCTRRWERQTNIVLKATSHSSQGPCRDGGGFWAY